MKPECQLLIDDFVIITSTSNEITVFKMLMEINLFVYCF